MKKFLYALLVLVGFAIVAPAVAQYYPVNPVNRNLTTGSSQIGHRGENPTTNRFGHRGENPNANRFGHRGENPNANNWQREHQGIRAISGTQYPR
jgi:hypothetical protein